MKKQEIKRLLIWLVCTVLGFSIGFIIGELIKAAVW